MKYWLSRVLREARERSQISRQQLATVAGLDSSTISRFEQAASWPQQVDRLVAAYAHMCSIQDGRELWTAALHAWRTHGSPPTLGELTAAQQYVLLALQASAQQPQPAPPQQPPGPTTDTKTILKRHSGSRPAPAPDRP